MTVVIFSNDRHRGMSVVAERMGNRNHGVNVVTENTGGQHHSASVVVLSKREHKQKD